MRHPSWALSPLDLVGTANSWVGPALVSWARLGSAELPHHLIDIKALIKCCWVKSVWAGVFIPQSQTDTWEKNYFYLLTGLSLPSQTHIHMAGGGGGVAETGCFSQSCIQKSCSAAPKQMDGHPSTFRGLSATMSSARGSWEVFSYILWPSFCLCSHHWHQNATVYGSPSSAHIFLSR